MVILTVECLVNQNGTKDLKLCGSIFYNRNLICGYGLGTVRISCYFTVVIENLSACSILVTLHGQLNQSVGEV